MNLKTSGARRLRDLHLAHRQTQSRRDLIYSITDEQLELIRAQRADATAKVDAAWAAFAAQAQEYGFENPYSDDLYDIVRETP